MHEKQQQGTPPPLPGNAHILCPEGWGMPGFQVPSLRAAHLFHT